MSQPTHPFVADRFLNFELLNEPVFVRHGEVLLQAAAEAARPGEVRRGRHQRTPHRLGLEPEAARASPARKWQLYDWWVQLFLTLTLD